LLGVVGGSLVGRLSGAMASLPTPDSPSRRTVAEVGASLPSSERMWSMRGSRATTWPIRDAECNHCLECVAHCPKPNVVTLRGASWRLSTPVHVGLLVAGLVGTIGVSQLAGRWRTQPEAVSFTDRKGSLDAGQMRGWMTLKEVSVSYGIPMDDLYRLVGLPAKVDGGTRLNQVAKKYGVQFEPDRLREAVEERLAGPPPQPAKAEKQPGAPAEQKAAPRKAASGESRRLGTEPARRGASTAAKSRRCGG
jgi:hypothetical protein